MEIKNKGDLIQAFVSKAQEVSRLAAEHEKASGEFQKLGHAIATDEDLMKLVHAGGVATAGGDLVVFNHEAEELQIKKCVNSYSLNDELNGEQLEVIGE